MRKNLERVPNGDVGRLSVASHQIELAPGQEKRAMWPHPAGPRAQEIENTKIGKMLEWKVFEQGETEWSSQLCSNIERWKIWTLCGLSNRK